MWKTATIVAAAVAGVVTAAPRATQTPQYQARLPGTEVLFEIRTSAERLGGSTNDQITILFCNTSGELQRTPPRPFLGEDIVAEFSFSGRDARAGSTFLFRRYVQDTSFLNARVIRVVNHGSDAWAGDTLSLVVGGRRILDRQSLYPRKGASNSEGLQNYNPLQWYERVYWEADFQRIRTRQLSTK